MEHDNGSANAIDKYHSAVLYSYYSKGSLQKTHKMQFVYET